jgi:hypothetical protein
MDPIRISSTLIGLLQQTSALVSVCYDYRRGIPSSDSEAIAITAALNELKAVSEALLRLVERSDAEGASQFPAIKLLVKDDGTLVNCLAVLEKLEEDLEPEEGWKQARKPLEWPLDAAEMKKTIEDLEGFIGTMRLALTADQATMILAVQDDIQDLSRLFQRFSSGKSNCFFAWKSE